MATEADAAQAASDDATSADADANAAEPTLAEVRAEVDRLKQENGRLRGNLRSANAQAGHLDALEARMTSVLTRQTEIVLDQTMDAEQKATALKKLGEDNAANSAVESLITKTQPRLEKAIDDSGLDWNTAEEFAEARLAWEAKDPATAISLVEQVLTEKKLEGTLSKEETEALVETKLKNANLTAAEVIDPDNPGGGGGGGIPTFTSEAEAKEYMRTHEVSGADAVKIAQQVYGT